MATAPQVPVGTLCPGCRTRLCHSPLLLLPAASLTPLSTAPHRTALRLLAAGAGEGQGRCNARCVLCVPAMYSVEITVEKDRVTGETKVLSSTTLLPQNHCLQGVKVYEDELKGTAGAKGRAQGSSGRSIPAGIRTRKCRGCSRLPSPALQGTQMGGNPTMAPVLRPGPPVWDPSVVVSALVCTS